DLDDVRHHVERVGPLANLISIGDDGAPHVVSVLVTADDDGLQTSVGGRSRANLLARRRLCLLWATPLPAPAPTPAGSDARYQLTLDGDAVTVADVDEGGRAAVTIEVTSGILHRVAGAASGGDAPSCLALDAPRPT